MQDSDTITRFLFEQINVRGELVHLDASWRAVCANHTYPERVRDLLGEALAAVALLSSTIKFEGALILQAQGAGPMRTLVAQATHRRTIRGVARWDGEVPSDGDLGTCFGAGGRLVLTVQSANNDPYQGIVALQGHSLATALEHYFSESEQLPTRLWLAVNGERAVGLLLQRLPGAQEEEDWTRVNLLTDTLTDAELLQLPTAELLHRLFHEETVRLFEPEPVAFRCQCSRQRIENTIRMLGQDEAEAVIAELGTIEVTCEFCDRVYRFDAVDTARIFTDHAHLEPPATHQ